MKIIILAIILILANNEFLNNIFYKIIKNYKCEYFHIEIDWSLDNIFNYYLEMNDIQIILENMNYNNDDKYNYNFLKTKVINDNRVLISNKVNISNSTTITILKTDIFKKIYINNINTPWVVNSFSKLKLRWFSERYRINFQKILDIPDVNKIWINKTLIYTKNLKYNLLISSVNNCNIDWFNKYFLFKIDKNDLRNNNFDLFSYLRKSCIIFINRIQLNCNLIENENDILISFRNTININHKIKFNIDIMNIFNPFFMKNYFIKFEIKEKLDSESFIKQEINLKPILKKWLNILKVENPVLNLYSNYEISFFSLW